MHVYCHSRKDGKEGCAWLVINNSLTEALSVELPGNAVQYTLHAEHPRATAMLLNGRTLSIEEVFAGESHHSGTVTLPPCSCTFFLRTE